MEYPEGGGCLQVDLTLLDMMNRIPDRNMEISIVAEDSVGNILKTKLNVSELS